MQWIILKVAHTNDVDNLHFTCEGYERLNITALWQTVECEYDSWEGTICKATFSIQVHAVIK